jgi:hypothetical protein
MHFSRILLVLASFLGIGTAFLPWKSETILGVTTKTTGLDSPVLLGSMQTGDGWIAIVCFGLIVLLAIAGRRRQPAGIIKKITSALLALVVAATTVYDSLQMEKLSVNVPGSLLSTKVAASSGIYICLAVAVFTIIISFSGKSGKTTV